MSPGSIRRVETRRPVNRAQTPGYVTAGGSRTDSGLPRVMQDYSGAGLRSRAFMIGVHLFDDRIRQVKARRSHRKSDTPSNFLLGTAAIVSGQAGDVQLAVRHTLQPIANQDAPQLQADRKPGK